MILFNVLLFISLKLIYPSISIVGSTSSIFIWTTSFKDCCRLFRFSFLKDNPAASAWPRHSTKLLLTFLLAVNAVNILIPEILLTEPL